MKKLIILIGILSLFICCNNDIKKENENYKLEIMYLNDSINVLNAKEEYYKKVINNYVLTDVNKDYKIDSILIVNDSLITELQIKSFQLERIKYYNEIAAKNNNIKFLRGWINRVFN